MFNKPLEPTEEMVAAGIEQLKQEMSNIVEDMLDYYDGDESQVDEKLSDIVVFTWQAMWAQG